MHIEKDQRKTSFLYFIFLSKYYDDKRTYQEKNVIEKKVKKKRKEVKIRWKRAYTKPRGFFDGVKLYKRVLRTFKD